MGIPVIDLFAGPGGLGEGFSSVKGEKGNFVFDIRLSIEKDVTAHKTLTLRSFYRQFIKTGKLVPNEYYEALRINNVNKREEKIEELYKQFVNESKSAKEEAQLITLGDKKFPNNHVDNKIRKALKGDKNWVLIGGPPCQAYSLVGRSRRQWKDNVDEDDNRVFLYHQYLRILAVHHPAVFVMENVKGMLSAKVNNIHIFKWIINDLTNLNILFPGNIPPKYKLYSFVKNPDYYDANSFPVYKNDNDFLIKTEIYGIPQKRHRVILLGIREDIKSIPDNLEAKSSIDLKSVINKMPPVRSSINRSIKKSEIIGGKIRRKYKKINDENFLWRELIEKFRREIISWNGLSNGMKDSFLTSTIDSPGSEYVKTIKSTIRKNHLLYDWIFDPRLKGVINHQSRSHLLEDLKRYLFLSIYTQIYSNFPRLHDYRKYSKKLLPEHQSATSGKFNDRFRVQLSNQPATTITSHISKDGHYYIHYDPSQCRSFTVREAARIQTFPDNYLFCGCRTQQFHQVGNAVPPYLANQLAHIVRNILYHI